MGDFDEDIGLVKIGVSSRRSKARNIVSHSLHRQRHCNDLIHEARFFRQDPSSEEEIKKQKNFVRQPTQRCQIAKHVVDLYQTGHCQTMAVHRRASPYRGKGDVESISMKIKWNGQWRQGQVSTAAFQNRAKQVTIFLGSFKLRMLPRLRTVAG